MVITFEQDLLCLSIEKCAYVFFAKPILKPLNVFILDLTDQLRI